MLYITLTLENHVQAIGCEGTEIGETKSHPIPSPSTDGVHRVASKLEALVATFSSFTSSLLHTLANLIFTTNSALIIFSILQRRGLKLREVT